MRYFLLNMNSTPPTVVELDDEGFWFDQDTMTYAGESCWVLRHSDGDTGAETVTILVPADYAEEIVELYQMHVIPVM